MSGPGGGPPVNVNNYNIAQATNNGCGSGCGGCLGVACLAVLVLLLIEGPWLFGTWLATQFGATQHGTARLITGWVFEIAYLIGLIILGVYIWKRRDRFRRNPAEPEAPLLADYTALTGTVEQPIPAPPAHVAARFCSQCGSQLADGQRYCPSCGKDLSTP